MTTTITPLPRNPLDGSVLLPGYARITLTDADFTTATAVPAGLTVSNAAIAGTSPAAVLRLTTPTAQFSSAQVKLPTVVSTAWEWLLLTVDMLIPATGIPSSGAIEFTGTGSAGAKWNNSARVIASNIGGSGGDSDLKVGPYIGIQTGRVTRRVAQLLLFPQRKIVAAMDGSGGVHGAGTFTGMVGGTLTPQLTIQTPDTTSKTLDVRRITLTGSPA